MCQNKIPVKRFATAAFVAVLLVCMDVKPKPRQKYYIANFETYFPQSAAEIIYVKYAVIDFHNWRQFLYQGESLPGSL